MVPPTGPFDVGLVVARLKAATSTLQRIAGAAERNAAAQDAGLPSPAAYVLLASEMPKPHSGGSQRMVQAVQATFAVVLRVKNVATAGLGMQGAQVLQSCITDVRAALLGWRPLDGGTACELAGAEIQEYDNGVIWWIETFRLTYFAYQTTA